MQRISAATLIALLVGAACAESGPTDPVARDRSSPFLTPAFTTSPVRPFGGRCDTDIAFLPAEPGDPPNLLRLHIAYVCQLQHLGRTTASAVQVVLFTSPTTAIASNTTIYTAANGDQLFATWTGTSTNIGPAITFSGTETYEGGSGRFAQASGSAWLSGTASFVTNTGQFVSSGSLSY